jgi:hypothetical protein
MGVNATGSVNNYYVNPPAGTRECDGDSLETGLNATSGKRFVSADVLMRYFFGQYTADEKGVTSFDMSGDELIKPALDLSVNAKMAILHDPAKLDEIYKLMVTANGGEPYANLFEKNGEAKDPELGNYLYTCGAQHRWFTDNPNSKRVGFFRSIYLRKDALFNSVTGKRVPARNVPIADIMNKITEWTKPAEKKTEGTFICAKIEVSAASVFGLLNKEDAECGQKAPNCALTPAAPKKGGEPQAKEVKRMLTNAQGCFAEGRTTAAINNPEGAENYPSIFSFRVIDVHRVELSIAIPAGAKAGAYPVTVSTTDDNGKTQSINAIFNLKEKPKPSHKPKPEADEVLPSGSQL